VNKRRITALLASPVLCAGVAGPSSARSLAAIKADGILKVGMTGDYAPFSMRRPGGEIVGADVTMAQSLARSLGVTVVIVPTTWKTLQADLRADKFDIAMGGVSVTPDRAASGYFSAVVLHDGKRPIVRCVPLGELGPLRAAAEPKGSRDFTPLWSGQAAALSREMPAAMLMQIMVKETLERLHRLRCN
jgi:cyclohexadienyl dehydratase